MSPTPEATAAEARRTQQDLERAYARVFGKEGARSTAQLLVWADMAHRGYLRRSTMVASQGGDIESRWVSAEGQRIFVLNTQTLIERGHASSDEPKPTRKAKTK